LSAFVRGTAAGTASADGTYIEYATAGSDTDAIKFTADSSFRGKIDDVSIVEVESIPADFDFTRGSNLSATRVGKDGYIEKGRENLLLQSNQFDTTWFNNGTTETSGQTGYDGSSNAWLLEKTVAGGSIRQSIVFNGVGTYSVYAKAGTKDWLRLVVLGSPSNRARYFDLANGTTGSSVYSTEIDSTITSVGGGWYRCTITTSISITEVRIYPADGDGINTATSGNIYIQDAQLEQGLVATDYIETGATTATAGLLEDEPRFDYSGGGCPALLLEPNRTNLFAQSEYYSGSYWSRTLISFTDNYTTSPEGVQNASRFISSGGSYPQLGKSISGLTIGQTYTASFYVKSDGTPQVQHTSWFTGFAGTTFTATDEWQRISFSITATAVSHSFVLFYNSSSAPASSFLLYGLQLEEGSYPTSYIPTYGSAATRSKEGASDSYDYMNLSATNLYSSTSYTYFLDINLPYDVGTSGPLWKDNDDIANNGGFQLRKTSPTGSYVGITTHDGSAYQGFATNVLTGRLKIAIIYNNGEVSVYYNGVQSQSAISVTGWDQSTNHFEFGDGGNGTYEIQQFLHIPTALSNNDCEIITGTSYASFASMASTLSYTQYE
jgi:hypothetical protein